MKPVYLDLSILIHEYDACKKGRSAWYETFGRKHVTLKMFLEAIQDRNTASELMVRASWFASDILHSQYNTTYWEHYYDQCFINDREWREARDAYLKSTSPDRQKTFFIANDESNHRRNVSCLTKLAELYVAQESAP